MSEKDSDSENSKLGLSALRLEAGDVSRDDYSMK